LDTEDGLKNGTENHKTNKTRLFCDQNVEQHNPNQANERSQRNQLYACSLSVATKLFLLVGR
jgi:hypothetical protein